jgi:hypothetical protein
MMLDESFVFVLGRPEFTTVEKVVERNIQPDGAAVTAFRSS